MKLQHSLTALAVIFAAGLASTVITACSGSASAAGDTVTMAQVNAAIAAAVDPLKQQIGDQAGQIAALQQSTSSTSLAALKSQLYTQAVARSTGAKTQSTRTAMPQSTATDSSGASVGTIIGYDTADPTTAHYYIIAHATSGVIAEIQIGASGNMSWHNVIDYTQAACQGPPYLLGLQGGSPIGPSLLDSGLVTHIGTDADQSDASTFWYLAPGTQPQTIVVQSQRNGVSGTCYNFSDPGQTVYALVPNDPAVTLWASGPTPVTRGTP